MTLVEVKLYSDRAEARFYPETLDRLIIPDLKIGQCSLHVRKNNVELLCEPIQIQVNLIHGNDALSRLRLGTSYKFGIMEAMTGFNKEAVSAGMQFGLKVITAGIVYEFLRDDSGGTTPESKLATEVAIKL